MRFAVGLALLTSTLSLADAAAQLRKGAAVRFSPVGGMHQLVADVIPHATKVINIAMYSVSPGQVAMWEPLRQAVARGVKCNVILNEGNKASNKAKAAAFAGLGCTVHAIKDTMHNKFMTVDGLHTCTGSSNWSKGAEDKYSENRICFTKHPAITSDYDAEFVRLWARSVPYTQTSGYAATVPGAGTFPPARSGVYNLFTSQNAANTALLSQALITAINGAKTALDVAVANYNTVAVMQAVCAAKARGLTVRVLTDLGQFSIKVSMVKALEACGVPVRYIAYGLTWVHQYSQLMHHKFLIADGAQLLTGSYNWSDTAEKNNSENLQWISRTGNSALVDAFRKEFNALWDLQRAKVPALVAAFTRVNATCVPIHWDTGYLKLRISLTRPELDAVRKKAYGAGLWDRKKASLRCVVPETGVFYPTVPQNAVFDAALR